MRVSVVNGICVGSDAISEAVRGSVAAIERWPAAEVRLFTYANDFTELDTTIVRSSTDVLLDKFFLESDAILYHFGVYYELFNSVLLGNGHARQVVYYHNITPKEFSPPSQYALVERSLRQRANVDAADTVLVASNYSAQDLVEFGISASKISVCPLYLRFEDLAPSSPMRSRGVVELLYVGRIVQSKGLLDLIDAVYGLRCAGIAFRLRLAGNTQFSDDTYLRAVLSKIDALGLKGDVVFVGQVSDAELWSLYVTSDIFIMPSYHEGFCVPIIEALAAGCVPLGYASGNIPELVRGYGRLVEVGDLRALTTELVALAKLFAARATTLDLGQGEVSWQQRWVSVQGFLKQFTFEAFAKRIRNAICAPVQER